MSDQNQKYEKIRTALQQLDPKNDAHWTDDGLPRTGTVQKLASDATITRKEIQEAQPGFQREPINPPPAVGDDSRDPLTGDPILTAGDGDPTQNTGEFMSEAEVRLILQQRVKDADQALTDAQQAVREAHIAVRTRQADVMEARAELTRQFPPMTAAQNIKTYIASEMAQRARAHGHPAGIAPGSQVDAAMQRSNQRGWRRPTRQGLTQLGAAKVS